MLYPIVLSCCHSLLSGACVPAIAGIPAIVGVPTIAIAGIPAFAGVLVASIPPSLLPLVNYQRLLDLFYHNNICLSYRFIDISNIRPVLKKIY
jgi:hypothetical protein